LAGHPWVGGVWAAAGRISAAAAMKSAGRRRRGIGSRFREREGVFVSTRKRCVVNGRSPLDHAAQSRQIRDATPLGLRAQAQSAIVQRHADPVEGSQVLGRQG